MAKGNLVGLDIGSSSIKVCQLLETKKGYQLQSFGMIPLPPETIVDGAVLNGPAVVDAIKELMASQKIKQKDVAISVSGYSVILRKISLPSMPRQELEENIQWEAEQYIPFDINDVYIDVAILKENNDQGQMDVLLVAAKREMINEYINVVREAGLNVSVVDVDSFAVQNAYEANYESFSSETAALINVGSSVVNINVVQNGVSGFTRDIAQGGNQFTDDIQKQLNVSYDEAEALKIGGTGESDAVVPQEVERILQQVSEAIANDIQRSLDFFSSTSADANINKIYLSGGCGKIAALSRAIENKTGVPVELLDPFRKININVKGLDANFLRNQASLAAVSIGLALRAAGDRSL